MAWKNFHGAKRLFLLGLSHQELINEAHVIRIEAAKLNEWRRKATYKLLGDPDHPIDDKEITPELLIKASHIRDEHYTNEYYKNQLLREVYKVLLFAMFVLVVFISVYLWQLGFMNSVSGSPVSNTEFYASIENWLLPGIILFGMLGGCISAIFHIRNSSDKTRIPEIVSNNYITSIRVFIGAALALIIYVFLQSGFVDQIFEIEIKPTDPFTYFAIAFVAGFTERLVLRAINNVAG